MVCMSLELHMEFRRKVGEKSWGEGEGCVLSTCVLALGGCPSSGRWGLSLLRLWVWSCGEEPVRGPEGQASPRASMLTDPPPQPPSSPKKWCHCRSWTQVTATQETKEPASVSSEMAQWDQTWMAGPNPSPGSHIPPGPIQLCPHYSGPTRHPSSP